MLQPDYAGGSLLNLMASLEAALGLPAGPYAPAGLLAGDPLAAGRNLVLLVIDGLGDDLLARLAPAGDLAAARRGRLTSVFPSTTASAIPTFLTGLPPAAHGLTGWHMWFAEIERILAVLPLTPRGAPPDGWLPGLATLPPRLFAPVSLSRRLAGRAWTVAPQEIVESPFNRYHSEGARRLGYQGTAGFFAAIEAAVAEAEASPTAAGPRFIHAYYPALDSLMHDVGTGDPRVALRLLRFEAEFAACRRRLAGSGTTFVVTADHGFIDAPPERLIELDQHPQLAAMLTRPLCGERRVAYAYVEAGRREDFAAYVRQVLGHACEIHRGADFIAAGWFGPGPQHPRLASRVGDFVLLMKDDWTIKDWQPDEKRHRQLGVHGGASAQEMHVPLILFRT